MSSLPLSSSLRLVTSLLIHDKKANSWLLIKNMGLFYKEVWEDGTRLYLSISCVFHQAGMCFYRFIYKRDFDV